MADAEHKLPRFYAPSLAVGPLTLEEGEAHHALRVLRLETGDPVELFDGQGGAAMARITNIRRDRVVAAIEDLLPPRLRPRPGVHLAFAIPKGKRLDWLLEKATELGAASLTPVVFQRSVAGGETLSQAKRQRWMSHCISSAKQCRLDFLPTINDPRPLAELLGGTGVGPLERTALRLVGALCEGALRLGEALKRRQPGGPIVILVGPEGDLTAQEYAVAFAAGFVPVLLGHTVLRVETAAVALLGAVMAMVDAESP